MNYKEVTSWLDGFQQFGIKLGLERITYLCEKLGNPQNNYKIIHIGGTNGKGSVCRYIGSILTTSGYRTGIYTSPHLQRFTERFVIGEDMSCIFCLIEVDYGFSFVIRQHASSLSVYLLTFVKTLLNLT